MKYSEEIRRKKKIQANVITGLRAVAAILLIPIFFLFGPSISAIFCIVFFLTDFIDGRMARKYQVQSFLGAFLDVISDKLLAIISLVLLSTQCIAMLLPIALELIIASIIIINYRKGKNVQASMIGKIKLNLIAFTVILSYLAMNLVENNNHFSFLNIEFLININPGNLEYVLYILLTPTILIQIIVAFTYALKKDNRENKEINEYEQLTKIKTIEEIKKDFLDTEFYLKNKDNGIKALFMK